MSKQPRKYRRIMSRLCSLQFVLPLLVLTLGIALLCASGPYSEVVINREGFDEFMSKLENNTSLMTRRTLKSFFRNFHNRDWPQPVVLMFVFDGLSGYQTSLCTARTLAHIMAPHVTVFDNDYFSRFLGNVTHLSPGETDEEIRRRVHREVGAFNIFANLTQFPPKVLELFFSLCDDDHYLRRDSAYILTVDVPGGGDVPTSDISEDIWDIHKDSRLALHSRVVRNVIDMRTFKEAFDVFC